VVPAPRNLTSILQVTEYPSGNVAVQIELIEVSTVAAAIAVAAGPKSSIVPPIAAVFPERVTVIPRAGEKRPTGSTSLAHDPLR
jgi:hypothetical protein